MDQQPVPPTTNPSLPAVPATWPGPFGLYKYSKQAIRVNLGALVILWLIVTVLGGGASWKLQQTGDGLSFLVSSLASPAFAALFLAGVQRQKLSLGAALKRALPLWLKSIGLQILVMVALLISALLFIIPFFFVAPRVTLVTYFLVDKNLGPVEAFKASWAATKGKALKAWSIIGAGILMAVVMLTIIGIPFSIYWLIMYSGAFAVFYEFLQRSAPQPVAPAV